MGGEPAINASCETIEAGVGGGPIEDVQNDLSERGVVSEIPMPTYGYMGRDEFYPRMVDGNLINDWVIPALKGSIYTDRKGRGAGIESPICQIQWENAEHT